MTGYQVSTLVTYLANPHFHSHYQGNYSYKWVSIQVSESQMQMSTIEIGK
jgi:hypothetical protein